MDLLRAWRRARREPPDQRNGHLAGSALGRIAGATDLPERHRDVPGDARPGHARLHRTRRGWVRILALVPGCREAPNVGQVVAGRSSGPAPDPDRHPAVHVGVGQPRPRARGRHHGEPHSQPLERADPRRQAGRRRRRRAGPGSDRTGAGAALRAPCRVAVVVLSVGPRHRRQGVGLQGGGVRDHQGRGRASGRDTGAGARRKPAWPSSSRRRDAGTWRS